MTTLQSSNINSPINLNLPIVPEVNNPELYGEASKIYAALRNLQTFTTILTGAAQRDSSEWPQDTPDQTIFSQNLNRLYGIALEVLTFGEMVNIVDNGSGIVGFRKATATGTAKKAHGWCSTAAGIAIGAYGEIQIGTGLCNGINGLTIGTDYYLSLNAGGLITATKPTGVGNILQYVGYGLGPSLLYYNLVSPPTLL